MERRVRLPPPPPVGLTRGTGSGLQYGGRNPASLRQLAEATGRVRVGRGILLRRGEQPVSTLRETVEERAGIPPDPALYLRDLQVPGETDEQATFWSTSLFRAALRAGALEPLDGLSELARSWRSHFESHPSWNPGSELKQVILSSSDLTKRDRREFEKLWNLAGRLPPKELAREVRPAVDRLAPETEGETAWRDLLLAVLKDIRRLFGKKRQSIVVDPDDLPFVPLVLDAILVYLRAVLALDHLREERIRFLVQRTASCSP